MIKSLIKTIINMATTGANAKGKSKEKTDKDWAALAKKKKVKTKFFAVTGHPVRRTSDGKAYFSPDQLWADAKAHYATPDAMWKDITEISEK